MAEAFPSSSSSSLSFSEVATSRLTTAEQYKQTGNDLYKEKAYKKAVGKYHRALLQVKDIDSNGQGKSEMLQGIMGILGSGGGDEAKVERQLPEGMAERVIQLEMSCYNNLAACLLRDTTPNYEKIVKYCEAVLERDEQNTKALYRKGVALYHKKDHQEAKEILNQALKHTEKDPDILRYLRLCDEAVIKQRETEKQRYQGVFKKMAEESTDG